MRRIGCVLLSVVMLICAFTFLPVHGEMGIYDSVIRLHVLAASDSEEDQALKLKVRDAVLAYSDPLLVGVCDRAVAEEILRAAIPEIERIALQTVRENGSLDGVCVTLGEEQYPTRAYEQLALPAGEYLSLRVQIGEAEGQNWWCVLFPPLCMTAAVDKTTTETTCLAAGLTGEQYRMIADTDRTKYKARFRIVEVAGALFQ